MNSLLLQTNDLAIGYPLARNAARIIGKSCRAASGIVAANLSLGLSEGELVCLLGPNGSGKSTLMRTLAGIQKPLNGEVFLGNSSLRQLSPKQTAKMLSLVLTDNVGTGNLSVYALVALGRYPYTGWMGNLSSRDEAVVRKAIETTGIRAFVHRHISDLSDGERQKVMIARALAQDTPVIMLDEPTAHLDLPNRIEVMRLLKQLARQERKAIVMSTHELDLALQAADRIWLMSPNESTSGEWSVDMVSGIPEALVLDGQLEKAFKRNGFEFDRHSGSFRIHDDSAGTIGLVGEGTEAFWTRRALERLGFQVVDDSSVACRVEVLGSGARRNWLYSEAGRKAPEEFSDISGVINAVMNPQNRISHA